MLKTEKDYTDPYVRQLSLFLDNRVGKLREVLRHLTAEDILVHALSVVDSADHAIVRLVVDRVGTACRALEENGVPTSVSQILAVEVPNERAGIRMICRSPFAGHARSTSGTTECYDNAVKRTLLLEVGSENLCAFTVFASPL